MSVYLLFYFLIIVSSGFCEELNDFSNEDNLAVRYLIKSSTDLLFEKKNDVLGAVDVIYDCSHGFDDGVVKVFDEVHPRNTKSVTVTNCNNITLNICKDDHSGPFWFLNQSIVKNVKKLNLNRQISNSYRSYDRFCPTTLTKVDISDIEHLEIPEFAFYGLSDLSVTVKNASINLGHKAMFDAVMNLHLQNVKIKTIQNDVIFIKSNSSFESTLIIRNSDFEEIGENAIAFMGSKVEISQNTFHYLANNAFSINSTHSFNFSGNDVQNMKLPFKVRSVNVQILNNTFFTIKKNWLENIKFPYSGHLAVLNVSGNHVKFFTTHTFLLNFENTPDIINIDQNYFNCSCQSWSPTEIEQKSIFENSFVVRSTRSVCVNLGNCEVHKVLKNMQDVCNGTFICPNSESEKTTESYLKMILSTLKSISAKLDWFTSKFNSSTESNQISPTSLST